MRRNPEVDCSLRVTFRSWLTYVLPAYIRLKLRRVRWMSVAGYQRKFQPAWESARFQAMSGHSRCGCPLYGTKRTKFGAITDYRS